ncbi:hypothetical protein MMC20_002579 [Loxospora ochrophaea]|nr:hypothetical protein [Loxospora ochrophaea]
MEGLIAGVSQNARSGAIVLALSSWHLFPDMAVVSPTNAHVRQQDPIFDLGAVLTLGLEEGPNASYGSIYWSLSMAHLRHYGTPVVSTRSIDSFERSRLNLNEFFQVTLGSLLAGWGDAGSDVMAAIHWLVKVLDILRDAAGKGSKSAQDILLIKESWFNLMLHAAKNHLSSCLVLGNDAKTVAKLISLGRRRGQDFLGLSPSPVFGLLEQGQYVAFIDGEEQKIAFLRRIATDMATEMGLDSSQIFIRYCHSFERVGKTVYEYASALTSRKRKHGDDSATERHGHYRLLYAGGSLNSISDDAYVQQLD